MALREQLAAPMQHNTKLASIEVARGVASVMVVFYHAARHLKVDYGYLPWAGVSQFGHAGVDFFFVLSGFIIFYVHRADINRPRRLANYFYRRFTRIYPYFWFSLIVGIAIAALSIKHSVPPITFLLLEAALMPITGDVGVAWTLQHEILFYIVFASAIFNLRIGLCVFAAWLTFLIGSWTAFFPQFDIPVLLRLSAPVDIEFFFGMAAAYWATSKYLKNYKIHLWLGLISFFAFGLAENLKMFDGYAPSGRLAYGLSSMLLVVGITAAESRKPFVIPKFLIAVGNASYSIYLFHLVCIGIAYKLIDLTGLRPVIPVNIQYVILVGAGVGGGMVLSRIIEFPLINMVRRLRAKFQASGIRSITANESTR